MELSAAHLQQLIEMLERRLAVIADTDLRENDPESQLAQLQEVSEAIMAFHEDHRGSISIRLNHFLENCSFDKALLWCEEALEEK